MTAKKPHDEPPEASAKREDARDRPRSAQHKRAVAAVQQVFRLCPLDAARWVLSHYGLASSGLEILEASWVEQRAPGPAYVVPKPRPKDNRPPSLNEVLGELVTRSIEQEAAASGGDVKVERVHFDFEEAQRQVMAKGGCDVELWMKIRRPKKTPRKPSHILLGVMLPDEHDDGRETHWGVLRSNLWHMTAGQLLLDKKGKPPSFVTMPVYLWPNTGLKDPQENCSVSSDEPELPGLLGALLAARSDADRERERKQNRKMNVERLERQQELDASRREAAARRLALMGDAGITEEELAALVPLIDVDRDRITMIQTYDILRLWELSHEELLTSLPPACLALSLFGHRPAGMSASNALERTAFALRRAQRDTPPDEAQRRALALAAVGAVFVEPDEVARLLGAMKLL